MERNSSNKNNKVPNNFFLHLPMIPLYQYLGESVFDYCDKDFVGRRFPKSMSISKQNTKMTSCFQALGTAGHSLNSGFGVGAQCTKLCNYYYF